MKVKVFLEALYDVPDDTDLEKLPDDILKWGLGPEEAVAYIKAEVKEIKDNPTCLSCGAVLTEILASHDYSIEHSDEQDKWIKNTGDVTYLCANCQEELDIHDIEGILHQVDEL